MAGSVYAAAGESLSENAMKMLRLQLAGILFAANALSAGNVPFDSLQELYSTSDLIIVGRIEGAEIEKKVQAGIEIIDSRAHVYHVCTLHVIKGDAPDSMAIRLEDSRPTTDRGGDPLKSLEAVNGRIEEGFFRLMGSYFLCLERVESPTTYEWQRVGIEGANFPVNSNTNWQTLKGRSFREVVETLLNDYVATQERLYEYTKEYSAVILKDK
jgi:hypothetical protein